MTANDLAPLWITYAWKDDEGGDFSYLVQELKSVGVPVTYDKIALVPGRRLWEQIAEKISASTLGGWASLLTPNSLDRPGCREELEYALDRALNTKGEDFPLIGLLHGVSIQDVPTALRVRLCVDLGSPSWREEVLAGVARRAPRREQVPQSQYAWSTHQCWQGDPSHTAIEVRPRFGTLMNWRLIVPTSARVAIWGHGPAGGGGGLAWVKMMVVEGTAKMQGTDCAFYGSGDALSSSVSAYVVIDGDLPEFIGFGQAQGPAGAFSHVEAIQPRG